jgi:hypothetical protein
MCSFVFLQGWSSAAAFSVGVLTAGAAMPGRKRKGVAEQIAAVGTQFFMMIFMLRSIQLQT